MLFLLITCGLCPHFCRISYDVRVQVLRAASMKKAALWDIALRGLEVD
jgi:hypothetical protein